MAAIPGSCDRNCRESRPAKKLSEAARLWAGGQLDLDAQDDDPADPDEPTEEQSAAAAFGLRIEEGDEDGAPAERTAPERTFWLLPDALPLWFAWHRLQTQWRIGASGERRGLDYAACTEWLRAHGWGHQRQRSLRHALDCLGGMERAALAVWADRLEREQRRKQLTRKH